LGQSILFSWHRGRIVCFRMSKLVLLCALTDLSVSAAPAAASPSAAVPALRGAALGNATVLLASWCGQPWAPCHDRRCCSAGHTCYAKDSTYAQCQPTGSCQPGIHQSDPVQTYWSCQSLDGPAAAAPVDTGCSNSWAECKATKCCGEGYVCFEKDSFHAQCRPQGDCAPQATQLGDPVQTPWTCKVLSEPAASATPQPDPEPAAPATRQPDPVTTAPCADNSEYCAAWAASGECSKNPDYMTLSCKASCGVCP